MKDIIKMNLSVSDAALLSDVTRQAIFVAIRKGRLKAKKNGYQWIINETDLLEYERFLYDRKFSKFGDKPLIERDEYSVLSAAKRMRVSIQHIYYAIRMERLTAFRKRKTWVIKADDLENYVAFRKTYKKRYNVGRPSLTVA